MNYSVDSESGPSNHIEVAYINETDQNRTYIIDNSLLVYFYKLEQPVELAIIKNKVLVNTPFNILTTPVVLFLLGVATLFIYSLAD